MLARSSSPLHPLKRPLKPKPSGALLGEILDLDIELAKLDRLYGRPDRVWEVMKIKSRDEAQRRT